MASEFPVSGSRSLFDWSIADRRSTAAFLRRTKWAEEDGPYLAVVANDVEEVRISGEWLNGSTPETARLALGGAQLCAKRQRATLPARHTDLTKGE